MTPPTTIAVLGTGPLAAGAASAVAGCGARTVTLRADAEELARESDALGGCELVIIASGPDSRAQHELLGVVAPLTAPACVLATTTPYPVAPLTIGIPGRDRVLGMHFCGPPGAPTLVELVRAPETSAAAITLARAALDPGGVTVVLVADGPGFLVNRANRPFSLEPQRLLEERVASVPAIDAICRQGGRFAQGPLERMDGIGLDLVVETARSFHAQSFGEPRWRPSPVAPALVAAGRLGRSVGRGFYTYPAGGQHRPPDPAPPASGARGGVIVVAGETTLAESILDAGLEAGWEMLTPEEAIGADAPFLSLDLTGGGELEVPLQGGPRAVCCAAGSLAALEQDGSAVGFCAVAPFEAAGIVELTRGPDTGEAAIAAAEHFFSSLGRHTIWVGDAPGLVLARIVCQLVNEAAFALGEGVASAGDIDRGMRAGLGYPHGPLEWGDMIGLDQVLATLEALCDERRDDRYRPAPELTRRVWTGRLGVLTGEGFHHWA